MKTHTAALIFTVLFAGMLISGCGGGGEKNTKPQGPPRDPTPKVLVPQATGKEELNSESVSLDISNKSEGYIMLRYSGSSKRVKVMVTIPDGTNYTYPLTHMDRHNVFPLTGGSGKYKVAVYEGVNNDKRDDLYSSIFSKTFSVNDIDEMKMFLYPNNYVDFDKNSKAVAKGSELAANTTSELEIIENVYEYVISNITYDTALAQTVTFGYVPDVDVTLEKKTGICFDYASLMASMLRSQGIPTKLEVGYSGEALHAWVSIYVKETGWVSGIIQFNGTNWQLMDPTLAANNDAKQVQKYIGDGSKYTLKYVY